MVCKACKNTIPDGSIFCNWCGERQVKQKKPKSEIRVPKPKQLPSGNWRIYLAAEGQSVTEKTADLCEAKAKAIRAGFIKRKEKSPSVTLRQALESYINKNDNVLSPATIRGYRIIAKNRFLQYQDKPASAVDWQNAVNEEAVVCSAKTLKNSWALVSPALADSGFTVPEIHLPQIPKKKRPWLNEKEIQTLLAYVKDKPVELPVLLALHSLRRSELLAVTPSMITDGTIHVAQSVVPDSTEMMILRDVNKNESSTRDIPILIPRLQEILDSYDGPQDKPIVHCHPNTPYIQVNKACRKLGLPEVGIHGLRRSFASLAYRLGWPERVTMQVGGWSDWKTMHEIYIQLDDEEVKKAADKMKKVYAQK